MGVAETVDARKTRLGADQALALADKAAKVIVARGRKVVTFDMRAAPPDQQALLKHMLGPTGNLRAPTILAGDVLLVGFDHDAYAAHLRG